MKNLDGIVIPTGSFAQDLERAKRAFQINEDHAPYIIAGIGRDTNAYLEAVKKVLSNLGKSMDFCPQLGSDIDTYLEISKEIPSDLTKDMDFHSQLWNYFVNKFKEEKRIFGVDINSLNSRQNLINTFPPGLDGRYAIVSYPLHLWGFKVLEKKLKLTGKISRVVKIEYIPSKPFFKQTPLEIIYGTAALIKHVLPYASPIPRFIKNLFTED
jgi:hypothetical protein